jgi:hypothetical protein
MTQEWFGEVRSLVQPPGTEGKWQELCALLSEPEVEQEREQWWGYVSEHLERHWPADALRVLPGWLERMWRGLPLPAAAGLAATLDLSHKSITDKQAKMVAMCAQLANLTTLDLSMNELGPDGARVIASSPHLRQVHTLSLARNRLELPALKMMLGVWRLNAVRALDLSGSIIHDAGACLLAASPMLAQLQRLDLSTCHISDDGALALARSPHVRGLSWLGLGWNSFEEGGTLRVLKALPFEVDLRGNATDAPMQATPDPRSVERRAGEARELRRDLRSRLGLQEDGAGGDDEDYEEIME